MSTLSFLWLVWIFRLRHSDALSFFFFFFLTESLFPLNLLPFIWGIFQAFHLLRSSLNMLNFVSISPKTLVKPIHSFTVVGTHPYSLHRKCYPYNQEMWILTNKSVCFGFLKDLKQYFTLLTISCQIFFKQIFENWHSVNNICPTDHIVKLKAKSYIYSCLISFYFHLCINILRF